MTLEIKDVLELEQLKKLFQSDFQKILDLKDAQVKSALAKMQAFADNLEKVKCAASSCGKAYYRDARSNVGDSSACPFCKMYYVPTAIEKIKIQ